MNKLLLGKKIHISLQDDKFNTKNISYEDYNFSTVDISIDGIIIVPKVIEICV